jgi:Predicted oxidoreductases (related to aryl-alcohol dehydrogenases)
MNKRKLGRTNLHVSELCFNAAKLGWAGDEAGSLSLLDAYREEGGGFVQSLGRCWSNDVGDAADARSEEIVGRWLKSREIARERVVIATRLPLRRPAAGGSSSFVNVIRECCEASLRRLRSGHIDLAVIEWDECLVPVGDVLEAIDMLFRAGLVRYAVASGFPSWRVVDSVHRSSLRNQCRFEAVQADFSLLKRGREESETLALCREHRLGFIGRSPLAGGYLGQTSLGGGAEREAGDHWLAERFGSSVAERVRLVAAEIAERHAVTPAQVALAWVLRHPEVASVLIAPTSRSELQDLVQARACALTESDLATLAKASVWDDDTMLLRHA